MSSRSSQSYAYYSFPPTPSRSSPVAAKPKPQTPAIQRISKGMSSSPKGQAQTAAPKTPTKLGRKPQSSSTSKLGGDQKDSTPASTAKKPAKLGKAGAQQAQDTASEKADDASQATTDGPQETSRVEMKDESEAPSEAGEAVGKAKGLSEQAPEPVDDAKEGAKQTAKDAQDKAEDAKESAKDTAEDAEDTADDATEKAGDTADDVEESTEESASGAQDEGGATGAAKNLAGRAKGAAGAASKATEDPSQAAEDATEEAKGAAEDVKKGAEDTAEDATEGAQDTAEGAKKQTEDLADEAKGAAEDATGQELPDLSILKGLEVGNDGSIKDKAGNTIGKLAEGDAEDLAGYPIGDNGEILDDDGDLVGRVELTPEKIQELQDEGKEKAQEATDKAGEAAEEAGAPDFGLLKGLEVGGDGNVLDDEGNTIGQLTEGEADTLKGYPIGDNGEILDEDGDLIGRVEFTEEGKKLASQAKDKAEDTAEDVQEEAKEFEPDLNMLNGLKVGEDGTVHDEQGNPVAKVAEGDAEDLVGYSIGDNGEILDDDGDLIGRVEFLPERVQQLKDRHEQLSGLDLSFLNGLEVGEDGYVKDAEGNVVGQIAEGDAEALAGYTVGENGEILDDDGDLVGRVEPTEEKLNELTGKGDSGGPSLELLQGLTTDAAGNILNDDGDTVGQLVEGDPSELAGKEFNEKGEILDDEGNVIGKAQIHPDAAELLGQAEEGAEGAQELSPDLPGLEALEGRQINEEGEVVDEDGNVLATLAEGDIEQAKGLHLNEKGEVVDEDGNVIGRVDLADGAQEKLAALRPSLDAVRILEGRKVNKKGKVLNDEGDEIGNLVEGELKYCAGQKVNDKGEVVDKDGNVIGKMEVTPGEAADEAYEELKQQLIDAGELAPEDVEGEGKAGGSGGEIPVQILEGFKVNKKGQVLNEDGEVIGELEDGDAKACAGKKVNENGEVVDKDGNVIGKVKVVEGEAADEAHEQLKERLGEAGGEEEGDDLPPLSILEGLTCNKQGKIIDDNGAVVGELVEGDAKKISKLKAQCDDQGQFWDSKGHVIGKAKTLPQSDAEDEPPFAGLEGLTVNKEGYVEDENGNVVGKVVEGDAKKLVGRPVDEDGDILDKKGSAVGRAERLPEEEEATPDDLSILAGRTVNKMGVVIGDEGVPIARLVEGSSKECMGKQIDKEGQIWNDKGEVIGRCELIPENEREQKPEGTFAGLEGLKVVKDGKVADSEGNVVGEVVEGDAKRLVGLAVDEDGDILDKYGNVKGHAERLADEEEAEPDDLSILDGLTLNKSGFLVNSDGIPVGRLVEGNAKELAGRKSDENGQIYSDTGKVIGRCELIPENERQQKKEGPFAGLEGLRVVHDGWVEDEDGNRVGQIVEGNAKRLVGLSVDEDGDIIDKYGNVKGHAEPWEEPEEEVEDLSALAGTTVNKAGNLVDGNGTIIGHVAEGDPKNMLGYKCDGKGQIWDNAGNVVGRAELAKGVQTKSDGPFSGFDNITVAKDGTVQTPDGTIVGRVIEGEVKKLIAHTVDEDGDISDKNGNVIGKAERWEPEEKERNVNPMSGRKVNNQGEVRDESGNLMGKLTAGEIGRCAGQEIDDNGYVVDADGNRIGEVTLLEYIQEEEEEELTDEQKKAQEDAEIAKKMTSICQQTLERMHPICKQITEYIDSADRTPKEELDEEELVNNVKPLIEEGGRVLQECNGSLRGLDPDGHIAAQAKQRAGTHDATPEEYQLADVLKELTGTIVTTIDNAKKKIQDMPHAKKKLNPLWALLTEPLFQIIAAVGLLLTGVLGLVGKLLNGLGLGGLVNGLLGGLGIDKLLGGLGLGSVGDALGLGGGDKDKKKGKSGGGIPLVGGLLGGGK